MKRTLLTLSIVAVWGWLAAQTSENDSLNKNALRVFIDCTDDCDMRYIRNEIRFVNYVRDVTLAELYILITSMNTGSGGTEYTLFFKGEKRFLNINDTLKIAGNASSTPDEIRQMLVQTLKLGMMRYVAHTPLAGQMEVALKNENARNEEVTDKWKNWVFNIGSHGYLSKKKSYSHLSFSGSLDITRITPDWKIKFQVNAYYSEQQFDLGYDIVKSYSRSYSFYHLLVRSLSEHWSLGGSTYASNSSYSNYNLNAWLTPAVEYNVFPYEQSTRRQLRILYKIGPVYNIYNDTTIFNKTRELLFYHRLSVSYGIIQKWGNISASLYASTYLHDFRKNNLSLYTSISIRIFRGLSFNLYGNYAMIHDQLSLPKAGASNEEILLQQRELATDFSYYLSGGLSYTFGSIYNNVVNPRFGD